MSTCTLLTNSSKMQWKTFMETSRDWFANISISRNDNSQPDYYAMSSQECLNLVKELGGVQ